MQVQTISGKLKVDRLGVISGGRANPNDVRAMNLYRALARGESIFGTREWGEPYVSVRCKEHGRQELVPSVNYYHDLHHWYDAGRHPRFSIIGAYLEAEQRYSEIPARWQETTTNLLVALMESNTPKQLIKRLHPELFSWYRFRGRRIRVRNTFREKAEAKSFTAGDFFAETNQELRRIILVRGCPIQQVLSQLHLIAEDSEGRLYDTRVPTRAPQRWRREPLYLYVVCPSTGQEYLLQVPHDLDPMTPSHARRWSFNLPPDAVFAQEA